MRFDHICLIVSDMDKAKKLWCDLLGFTVFVERELPDGTGPDKFFDQSTLDDIFHVKQSKSLMCLLASDEGASIELQQPINPEPRLTPSENLQYGSTGIHEVALNVKGIEDWYKKVKDAGYEMQTPYVWEVLGGINKSFLFYDFDGNMIQLCEN